MIAMDLRGRLHECIRHAQKLQEAQALANSNDVLDNYIQQLDDILANVLSPFERQLDAAHNEEEAA
jgi:hypothetical protein